MRARTCLCFDRAVGRTVFLGNRCSAAAADAPSHSAVPADFVAIAAVGPSRFAAAPGPSLIGPAFVDLDSVAGSSSPFAVVAEAGWGTVPAVSFSARRFSFLQTRNCPSPLCPGARFSMSPRNVSAHQPNRLIFSLPLFASLPADTRYCLNCSGLCFAAGYRARAMPG